MKSRPVQKILFILTWSVLGLGTWSQADWQQVGACLNNDPNTPAAYSSIAFYQNTPYVAYCEGRPQKVYVKYYNGSQWEQLGGYLNVSPYAGPGWSIDGVWSRISVREGVPYVAWVEQLYPSMSQASVYVKKYNGTDWEWLGESTLADNPAVYTGGCSLDVHLSTPYVAYNENGSIHMKYFNGSTWQYVGNSTPLNASTLSLNAANAFVADDGTPYVSWREIDGRIYVKYFSAGYWNYKGSTIQNELGNPTGEAPAYQPGLYYDHAAGIPYITWSEYISGVNHVYARTWGGTAWNWLGDNINNDTGMSALGARMTVSQNVPYVSWQEVSGGVYQIYVKYYTGTSWKQVSENNRSLNLDASNDAIIPEIAASANGNLFVTWTEGNALGQIYVKTYASPTHTPTSTMTPTCTTTPSITPTATITPTETASPTVTESETSTQTGTVTATPTQALLTNTATYARTATATAMQTTSATLTETPTQTATAVFTQQGSLTFTPSQSSPWLANTGTAMPNPFLPGRGQKTHFNVKPADPGADFTIRIYNLRAQLQRTLYNVREWDGRNESGQLCEGGVYLYQIECGQEHANGKVVLVK